MAKKMRWKKIKDRSYILKFGDAITLHGTTPQALKKSTRICADGFIVSGYAGHAAEDILSDYNEEDNAEAWTQEEYNDNIPTRLASNSRYSEPLPLP